MKATSPTNILPEVLTGFAQTKLVAYARDSRGTILNVLNLLKGVGVSTNWTEDTENDQLIFHDEMEFCGLNVHCILSHAFRTRRVEGTVFFDNSLDARGPFTGRLSVACLDGPGEMLPRAMVAHALTPDHYDRDYSEWSLRATEIAAGNMTPFLFVLTYGEEAGLAVRTPRWIRRRGRFVLPDPEDSNHARVTARHTAAQTKWWLFNQDAGARANEAYLFGEYANTGSAGDQPHLGYHPIQDVTDPQVSSDFAADHMRCLTFWIEGKRRYHWKSIPFTVRGSEPGSFYNFYGPHTTSKYVMGYTYSKVTELWTPPFGNLRGVAGYGLEHFKSRVPELAFYTQDPAAFELTARIARALLCTLHSDYYYGGQYTTLRGMLRPLGEMIECVVALESSSWTHKKYVQEINTLRDRITEKIDWLATHGFSKNPWNPNEQIPGHETEQIIELWQTGFAVYVYAWYQYTGNQDALDTVVRAQRLHNESWKGTDRRDLMMPKFVLASDRTIGRGYGRRHDGLVLWNLGLLSIRNLPNVDQALREEREQAILLEYPDGNRDGKWAMGSWDLEDVGSAVTI